MLESIARLIFELILPSSQLLILLVIIGVLFFFGWRRRAWQVGIVLVVLWLVYATPFLSDVLIDRLQHTYPVLSEERMDELGLLHSGTDEPGLFNPETNESGLLNPGTTEPGHHYPGETEGALTDTYPAADLEMSTDPVSEAQTTDLVHIIILGSSHTPDDRLLPTLMLSDDAVQRLVEALRVYRLMPEARLITSGRYEYGEYSQAEATRDALISLGVDPEHILIQPEAASTCDEARAFVREHGPGARIIISTSALHMRRAMMIFDQQEASPVAAPAAFIRKQKPEDPFRPGKLLPSWGSIGELESAIKEYVGYAWERRRCR